MIGLSQFIDRSINPNGLTTYTQNALGIFHELWSTFDRHVWQRQRHVRNVIEALEDHVTAINSFVTEYHVNSIWKLPLYIF